MKTNEQIIADLREIVGDLTKKEEVMNESCLKLERRVEELEGALRNVVSGLDRVSRRFVGGE